VIFLDVRINSNAISSMNIGCAQ